MTELNKRVIEKMSFNKLREELLEAQYNNNKVREFMIKNLMKLRYLDYQKNKHSIIPNKNERSSAQSKTLPPPKKQIRSITKTKKQVKYTKKKTDNTVDNEESTDNKSLGSLDSVNSEVKDVFEGEIERDNMNHDLMERLNSDILIREGNNKHRPEIISPYGEDGSGNFAQYKKTIKKNKNDFTKSGIY